MSSEKVFNLWVQWLFADTMRPLLAETSMQPLGWHLLWNSQFRVTLNNVEPEWTDVVGLSVRGVPLALRGSVRDRVAADKADEFLRRLAERTLVRLPAGAEGPPEWVTDAEGRRCSSPKSLL